MNYRIAYSTIVSKEIHRFMRIWPQTMLPPAVTTALYFLIFGTLMGARIGSISGIPYIDYIVPGVILMSVINHSYANVVSSFYSTKFQRHIEELLVSPVPNWIILAGYISGGVARGLIIGAVVVTISIIFTQMTIANVWISIAVIMLTATLFSLAGFINAIFADSFDHISLVPNFILTPLTYLGGVFYSIDMLPEIWQKISQANPLLYMINAFRYGVIGVSDVKVEVALAMVTGTIVVLILFSLYLLDKGIGIKT